MGPVELHERINERRKGIEDKLSQSHKLPGDYATAYREYHDLTLWIALQVIQLDPAYSYDNVMTREA